MQHKVKHKTSRNQKTRGNPFNGRILKVIGSCRLRQTAFFPNMRRKRKLCFYINKKFLKH